MSAGRIVRWLAGKPKVIHRLPGRVRIHIGILRRLPQRYHPLAAGLAPLLSLPEGILDADVQLATGNVLIRYDPGRISERQVVGFVRRLFDVFLRHESRLRALPEDRLPEAFAIIRKALENALRGGTELDSKVDILPDASL